MTVAKSANTWFQLPLETKLGYKSKLIQLHGLMYSMNGNGCGNYFPFDMLTIDHIIPISMGGPVCEIDNLQFLCFRCHKRKTMIIDNKGRAFEFAARHQNTLV
jgi:NAD-dependent SIR2 family protein deacetylase